MKKILMLILLSVLVTSCAQLIHDGMVSLNKDKHEKALEYREGDIVEFKSGAGILLKDLSKFKKGTEVTLKWNEKFTVKDRAYLLDGKFHSQSVTRYGLTGDRFQKIANIKISKKWNKVISGASREYLRNIKFPSFKAKVIKVGRKCKPDTGTMSKCVGGTFFEDKLEFVSWSFSIGEIAGTILKKQSLSNSKNKRMKQKELALKRKRKKYFSSSQSSSDFACVAQGKYKESVNWLNQMKKQGVKTLKMMKVANQIPSLKTRINSFKSEYKQRSGKSWNRKCPNSGAIEDSTYKKYGIMQLEFLAHLIKY